MLERRKIATSGTIDIGPDEVTTIELLLAVLSGTYRTARLRKT